MDRLKHYKTLSYRPIILLLCTTIFLETLIIGLLIFQKAINITYLPDDGATHGANRVRRQTLAVDGSEVESVSPSEVYLPLYAKLSDKSLKAICEERSKRRKKKHDKWNRTKNITNSTSRIRRLNSYGCGLISSISQPHILARRLNKVGGIVRHGTRWFQDKINMPENRKIFSGSLGIDTKTITEYSLGYNVFEYSNLTELRHSRPSAVHSLDTVQFDGTDNTACSNDTFIYYAAATSRIYSYKISERRSQSVVIRASKTPIYQSSYSYVDLESYGGHLWVLYHSAANGTPRASFLDCSSLAERKSWTLQFLDTNMLVNAFIACDHLYTVTQNDTSNILNVFYDFSTNQFFEKIPEIGSWKRYGIPSSVHYDHISKTINVFDDGIIYSIAVRM